MKVFVGTIVRSGKLTAGVPFNRYEGFCFMDGVFKDHRRIKRDKRRAKPSPTPTTPSPTS